MTLLINNNKPGRVGWVSNKQNNVTNFPLCVFFWMNQSNQSYTLYPKKLTTIETNEIGARSAPLRPNALEFKTNANFLFAPVANKKVNEQSTDRKEDKKTCNHQKEKN